MRYLYSFLEFIPKLAFATALVISYVFFGGLNGAVESTFAVALFLGFLIGREFYKSDRNSG